MSCVWLRNLLIFIVCAQLDVMVRRQFDPSFSPSVAIPELRTSATGMALTMGVFANMRYQLLGGIDRYLFDHSNFLLPYLGMSTAFRAVSTWYGQETRLHLQVRQLLQGFLPYLCRIVLDSFAVSGKQV